MKNLGVIFLFLTCAPLMFAQSNVANDARAEEKKSEVIKCLALAAMGARNVAIDHLMDAAKIIYDTPDSEEEIVYQSDNPVPDDYIIFFKKELFSKQCWKRIESGELGLRQRFHDAVFNLFKANQQRIKPNISAGEEIVINGGLSDFAYKIVDRFYLPNYRAVFINNMYYHTDFKDGKIIEVKEYIKKEDLPLVIEALNGK